MTENKSMRIPKGYVLITPQELLTEINSLANSFVYFYIKTTSGRIFKYRLEQIHQRFSGFTYIVYRDDIFRCFTEESFIDMWNNYSLLVKTNTNDK